MLENLKIVELASVLAGPAVGLFFAESGAEVVKIENQRTGGDVTRSWKLAKESKTTPVSAYFSSVNWGKKHLLLDYKDATDFEEVLNYIRQADVVIANFKAGDAEKFGLDYTALKAVNPQLIYGAITGFDHATDRVAYDVVLQAEAGYMFMNGQADGPPTKMPLALIDVLAAHQLKEGLLVALLERIQTGKGAYVEASLERTAIASLTNQASNWLMAQHLPQRIGSLHPNIAPYGETFLCADDKYLVLAIGSDRQFRKLCELLEATSLADDAKFTTNALRVTNRTALAEALSKVFKTVHRDAILSACIAHHVPAGAIKNLEEVFETEAAQAMILEQTEADGSISKRVATVAYRMQRD